MWALCTGLPSPYHAFVTQRDISDTFRRPLVGTVAKWRAAGLTVSQMRSLIRSGDLVRMRHGVYANRSALTWGATDPRRSHALPVIAATWSAGRDSVASHQSAARIYGLDLLKSLPEGVVTLTRAPSRRRGQPSSTGIVFHTAALPAEHVTKCRGTLVTTPARTVVDLARTLPFVESVVTADSAATGLSFESGRKGR